MDDDEGKHEYDVEDLLFEREEEEEDDDDLLEGEDAEAEVAAAVGAGGGLTDLSRAKSKVWLVQVPNWLYEHWSKSPSDNFELGDVTVQEASDPNKPSTVKITLTNSPLNQGIPKDFQVEPQSDTAHISQGKRKYSTYAMSENNNSTAFEGIVESKLKVTPVLTQEYHKFMQNRTVESNEKQSALVITGAVEKPKFERMRLTPAEREKEKQAFYDKRTERLPPDEIKKLVFQCFHQHKYWNLKGLLQEIRQPEVYLKEILKELCILNRSGKYNNLYQLKPEHVVNVNAPETSNVDSQNMMVL